LGSSMRRWSPKPALAAAVLAVSFLGPSSAVEARDPLWEALPWQQRMGVEWFQQKAERGDPEAQFHLAEIYERGVGAPADLPLAAKWYEEAAKAGHAKAQFRLATLLWSGRLGQSDFAGAARWFQAASEQGIAPASFNLAVMVEQGLGQPRDLSRAAGLYETAFRQGIAQAALPRGLLALNADPPRAMEAMEWFLRAEDAGVAEASALAEAAAAELADSEIATARARAAEPLP